MAFKVKATLVDFAGDEERFPCHFLYKKGDSFIYDGEQFHGRICPGLLGSMEPALSMVYYGGPKCARNVPFFYAGLSARDESMAKYDGRGWRTLKEPPAGCQAAHAKFVPANPPPCRVDIPWSFVCPDVRASACFIVEAIDIASGGHDRPFYNRSMAMLKKIKAEPGLTPQEIRERFTEWERTEIYPPLNQPMAESLLEQMEQVGYLENREGKYYPLERASSIQDAPAT